jgi:filamentous hemagglutinin
MAKTLINVGVMFLTLLLGVASARGQSLLDLESESLRQFRQQQERVEQQQKQLQTQPDVSGPSEGVRGDGVKAGGTRVDLDLLCGADNARCTFEKNSDGTIDYRKPVTFEGRVKADGTRETLEDFLKTPEGQKMAGATGGVQGVKGTLFGVPYAPGSWQDKLIESFAGSHDFIGGKASGLYDAQGNIKRGMSDTERATYDKVITTAAIPLAAPFAAAEGMSPEIWKAIGILLGAGR